MGAFFNGYILLHARKVGSPVKATPWASRPDESTLKPVRWTFPSQGSLQPAKFLMYKTLNVKLVKTLRWDGPCTAQYCCLPGPSCVYVLWLVLNARVFNVLFLVKFLCGRLSAGLRGSFHWRPCFPVTRHYESNVSQH